MLEHVFPGDTEMARRMREFDWSKTPLGPVDGWSQALRTSVSICLNCAFGIVMWWGPDFTILYNDEYQPILGPEKHPAALGRECRTVWAEIWDTIGPMLSQVMERAEATRSRDLLLHIVRQGYPEEAYFSFSYSPIHDDDGQVRGIFCPVIETTEKVIGERRLRMLRDLAAECKSADSEQGVHQSAALILSGNPQDVPFALLYRIDRETKLAELQTTVGIEPGLAASPRTVVLREHDTWSLGTVAESGQPAVVTDLSAFGPGLPTGAWKGEPHCAMVLPVLLPGQSHPSTILVAAVSPMRALDEAYRTFFGLVATQIASGLADAQALEEERRRAAALAEIDRAKTAFFSNVSHEFRTPLTLMLAPLEDALAHGDLPASATAELTVVRRNSRRLLKLVNTLLDFSRIEAGRIQATYEPTDVAALTSELASTFRSATERAGVQLLIDCERPGEGEPVYLDHDMWEKIVLNLLSNAFKYTFHGKIQLRLKYTREAIELSVSDTGTGIPAEAMPHLFERFYRVENARGRTHEGSGIGLALVSDLARLHGGSVRAESELGVGSTFTVSVPRGKAHLPPDRIHAERSQSSTAMGAQTFVEEAERWLHEDPQAAPPDTAVETEAAWTGGESAGDDLGRATIVLADDNADMLEYIERLLSKRFRVRSVRDGEAALEAIRRERPALVITDIMMPRLDGFGLLRALRSHADTRTIPVIVLSARAGEEAEVEGLRAGADAYLVKPFTARELTARVEAAIQLSRIRREAEVALRLAKEQFETLVNTAPLGVYLVDADFRIREVNPIALPVFGDIPGGVVGRDFDEVIHILWEKDYADEVVQIFRRTLETGESYITPERARYRIDRNATEYYEWRLDRISLPDGRPGVVCYFRDISTHVRARQELAASVDRLTQVELALQDANRQKDDFLATLAHELRNPLAPIRNSLHILRTVDTVDPVSGRVYQMMERQVNQLMRLVDDLLDVARITRGQVTLQKEHVELAAIIDNAIETSRPLIDGGRHRVTLALPEEPVVLEGDLTRLTQVFANLLNNAAKYTDPEGTITVTAKTGSQHVEVSVTDSGRGIPADTLPRVFELFAKGGRQPDNVQGGLGIGLSLVRKLVELHGGEVEAHSAGTGKGSTFVVRLPRAAPQPRASAPSAKPDAVSPLLRRVLVVDDNHDAADSLGMLLQFRGSDARVVYGGEAALAALSDYKPTMVLLDIGMPGMDGYEVAKQIRARPEGQDVMLIALTGWGQESDRRRAKRAGFDHHLTKPVDIDALPGVLQKGRRNRATGRI